RRRRGRGRIRIRPVKLKIERINDKRPQEREITYLERVRGTQPLVNAPKRCWEVHRPRRRRGRIKSVPTNVSRAEKVENAYLGRVNAIRSKWRPKKQIRRLNMLTFECRMPGEPWRNVEDHG